MVLDQYQTYHLQLVCQKSLVNVLLWWGGCRISYGSSFFQTQGTLVLISWVWLQNRIDQNIETPKVRTRSIFKFAFSSGNGYRGTKRRHSSISFIDWLTLTTTRTTFYKVPTQNKRHNVQIFVHNLCEHYVSEVKRSRM